MQDQLAYKILAGEIPDGATLRVGEPITVSVLTAELVGSDAVRAA